MKKKYLVWMCLLIAGILPPKVFGNDLHSSQEPIMTFYNSGVPGFSFSFSLKFKSGSISNDSVYVDFGNGKKLPFYVSDTNLHYVSSKLTHDSAKQKGGIIKVYADSASHISYLKVNAQGVKSMDISKCTNLIWLECHNNLFTEMNLSFFPNLQFFVANYNRGIKSIDFSNNLKLEHINIEQLGINSLDVTKLPNLLYLNVTGNNLTELDLSNNLKLYQLLLSQTKISKLDVSIFPNLISLSVSSTPLKTLDVSKNPNLFELYLTRMPPGAFTSIDVSQNTKLVRLFCSDNSIRSIDVSKNPILESLFVSNNELRELDLSNNPAIKELSIYSNYFKISTIPPLELGLYFLSPQKKMQIQDKIKVGEEIDLSSELMVLNTRTKYVWYKGQKLVTLLEGVDYTLKNGKTTFLKKQDEAVFCALTNTFFSGLKLETTTMNIEEPISNEKIESENINIFAANKQISVSAPKNVSIAIFNIQGHKIYDKIITTNYNFFVPIAGMYIVKVDMEGEIITRKVIVL